MGRRIARLLVAPVVLPHELGHALAATVAGLHPRVAVLPEWDGQGVALGQFDAALDPGTPTWAIRAVALAPTPLFFGLAAVAGSVVPPDSVAAVLAFPALAYWASLSDGDLAVATRPAAAREAGRFVAPATEWHSLASLALVTPNVVVVALLLFR